MLFAQCSGVLDQPLEVRVGVAGPASARVVSVATFVESSGVGVDLVIDVVASHHANQHLDTLDVHLDDVLVAVHFGGFARVQI